MAVKIKLNVQVTESLLKEVDKYAEEMNLSRSAAVSVMLSNSLKADAGMATIKDLMKAYNEQMNSLPKV